MANLWKKIFSAEGGTNLVQAIAKFKGELYVGASLQPAKPVFIYRLSQNGCKKWQDVTPTWSSQTRDIGGLVVFKGQQNVSEQLYVGTEKGEVFRTADGTSWSNVSGSLPLTCIKAMHVFDNYLYVAGWQQIWRTSDGSSWTRVDEDRFLGASRLESFEEFENHLYAGVGFDNYKGIQLWRTDGSNNGKSWKLYKDMGLSSPDWVCTGHLHALKAFKVNKKLYVGKHEGTTVFCTDGLTKPDGTALNWDYIANVIPDGYVFRFEEHEGKFYLGVRGDANKDLQTPLLFESVDGKNWSVSPVSPKCSLTTETIGDLYSDGNKLYVGIGSLDSNGLAEVWELGPPILADAYEPNNDFDDATKVDLGLTATKAVKFTDLTLHNGDVDFFEIEFEKQEEECFSSFKKDLGAGIVAEINPGNLTISVEEEYCNDLFFEVYDADKNLKGTFKNTVVFTCLGQEFNGQKLFVVVKPLASGLTTVRYNLSISQSGWWGSLSRPTYEIDEFAKMPTYLARLLSRARALREFISKIVKEPLHYSDPNDLIKDAERYLPEFIEHRSAIDKAHLEYGLGYINHKIGQLSEAERFYRSSLATFKELGITSSEADVLRNLGDLLTVQGKTDEALLNFKRASQLHDNIEDSLGLSQDRVSLGRFYLNKREVNKSLDSLQKALNIQIATSDICGSALNLLYQSEAFLTLKKEEAAVACLLLAEDLAYKIEEPVAHQRINRRMESLHMLLTTELGERKTLELKKSLAGQAETVWYQAITQIERKN